ncbi:MAG: TadE family protein [Gammaproteobacteria bacterium]
MENSLRATKRIRQCGIATIEFAIAVPVLLLLMLATAELGRAFYTYNTLTKSVRDGARYLSTVAKEGTGIVLTDQKADDTENLVVYGQTTGGSQPLLPSLTTNQVDVTSPDAEHVQVTAAYPYAPIFASGIPTFGFGSGNISVSFTMSASVTMRAL